MMNEHIPAPFWRETTIDDVKGAIENSYLDTICGAFAKNYRGNVPYPLILLQGVLLMSTALTHKMQREFEIVQPSFGFGADEADPSSVVVDNTMSLAPAQNSRVYINTCSGNVPNAYVLVVAPSGAGKGSCCTRLARKLGYSEFSGGSLEGIKDAAMSNPHLLISLQEFGALLQGKGYKEDFKKGLTDMFSAGDFTILLTEVAGGMEKWTKAGTIRMLRFDPVNCGRGKIEIRAIRLLDRSGYRSIAAGTDGVGYGSSVHQHIWHPGNKNSGLPRIVGKGNQFDHRYRFLMRFPTDLVLPDGAVKDATLYFTINGFYGKAPKRTYLVEIIEDDLPKLLPSTLSFPKAHTVLRFEAGVSSNGHTIAVPITEELNKALENLWGSVTFRVRPESEPNTDPGASGMSINHLTVHIDVR